MLTQEHIVLGKIRFCVEAQWVFGVFFIKILCYIKLIYKRKCIFKVVITVLITYYKYPCIVMCTFKMKNIQGHLKLDKEKE